MTDYIDPTYTDEDIGVLEWNDPEQNTDTLSSNYGKWYVSATTQSDIGLNIFLKQDAGVGIPISAIHLDEYYFDREETAIGTIVAYRMRVAREMKEQGITVPQASSTVSIQSEPLFGD